MEAIRDQPGRQTGRPGCDKQTESRQPMFMGEGSKIGYGLG